LNSPQDACQCEADCGMSLEIGHAGLVRDVFAEPCRCGACW
jgi:hypothetical protein